MKNQVFLYLNSIFNKSIRFISVLIFLILPLTASYAEHKQKFVVGYAQDNMANDWRAAQIKQLEKEFSKQAVKFVFTDARGSAANQIRNIEDLIYQKVDLLMTSPMDAALMTPVISQIYKNGTPVVLVTRNILTDDFTSFVAPDDKEIAQQAAAFVAGKLKGQGNILILKGVPTATTAIARTEGFLAEIKKYPGIKISAIKVANYLRGEAIQKMDEVIAEKIPYDAIYAQSDSMATGARLAMVKAGIDPASKIIVGIDYIREAHEAIKNGTQTASFLYPTSASQAASIVIKILHNEKVPKHVKVETQIITKDNVDKIKPIF